MVKYIKFSTLKIVWIHPSFCGAGQRRYLRGYPHSLGSSWNVPLLLRGRQEERGRGGRQVDGGGDGELDRDEVRVGSREERLHLPLWTERRQQELRGGHFWNMNMSPQLTLIESCPSLLPVPACLIPSPFCYLVFKLPVFVKSNYPLYYLFVAVFDIIGRINTHNNNNNNN